MPTKISKVLATSILAFSLCVNLAYAAWTEPTTSPSAGNVPAPINTSNVAQMKIGDFTTLGLGTLYDLSVAGFTTLMGNVGIDTTDPGMKLEVGSVANGIATSGSTATGGFRLRGASPAYNNVLDMGIVTGGSWLQSTDGTDLSQKYNLLLNPNGGNVGIGTTNPNATLDIAGSNITQSGIYFGPSNGAVNNTAYHHIDNAGGANYHVTGSAVGDLTIGAKPTGGIIFGTNNSATTPTARMYISSGGNVGIGTPTPSSLLQIGNDVDTTKRPIRIGNVDYGTNEVMSVAPGVVNFDAPGIVGGRLKIDSAGNVGIGTGTATPGAKLEVVGTIKANGDISAPGIGGAQSSVCLEDGTNCPASASIGSGTAGKITKWLAGGTTLGDSVISESSGNVTIGGGFGALWAAFADLLITGSIQGTDAVTGAATDLVLNPDGGNVGIGTPDPGAKLDITNDGILGLRVKGTNTNAMFRLLNTNTGGDFLDIEAETAGIQLEVNDTDVMKLSDTGNVGIGTTEPGAKLDVNGDVKSLRWGPKYATWSGIGDGGAAIVNSNDEAYKALMIVGSDQGTGAGRVVKVWDTLQVQGPLSATTGTFSGNVTAGGKSVCLEDGTNCKASASIGSGTAGKIAKWLNSGQLEDSVISESSGNVTIGTIATPANLEVTGSVTAGSFITSTSDLNLKKNIMSLSGQLGKILQLRGVSFDWKKNDKHSTGLIAQEVEEVYPDLVLTDKTTGLKSVAYGNLVAPLIEAVKEQQKQIDALKAEIEKLKK